MIDNITLDNLHIGCKASNKAEVIAMIGAECKAKGYVNQECVHFLLEREHQVSTFLGNGITLPHLPKSATDIILKTGIEIFQFPDGVIWDRSNVMFIAIGVILTLAIGETLIRRSLKRRTSPDSSTQPSAADA